MDPSMSVKRMVTVFLWETRPSSARSLAGAPTGRGVGLQAKETPGGRQ